MNRYMDEEESIVFNKFYRKWFRRKDVYSFRHIFRMAWLYGRGYERKKTQEKRHEDYRAEDR